jgi:hypothetical protein
MSANGWIKLHRAITEWEWYGDANTMRLFVHLLLTASRAGGQWHGFALQPGDALATYPAIAAELRMSEKAVRVAFGHLRQTGEITLVANCKHGSVWRVNNWPEYQTDGDDDNLHNQPEGQAFRQAFRQEKGQAFDGCNTQETNDLQKNNEPEGQEKGQEKGQPLGHQFKKLENNNIYINARARELYNNTTGQTMPDMVHQGNGIVPYPTTTGEVIQAAAIAGMVWTQDMAMDFLDHYNATGWRACTGPLRDWRYKLRPWYENARRSGWRDGAKDRTKKGL